MSMNLNMNPFGYGAVDREEWADKMLTIRQLVRASHPVLKVQKGPVRAVEQYGKGPNKGDL